MKRFPLFIWLLFAVSSVSNFRPDTGRRRWSCSGSLVQSCCGEGGALQADIAVCGEHSPCSGHIMFARSRVCALPVYTAQAPGCSIWSMPCIACGSSFWVLHESVDSIAPVFCAFPGPSSIRQPGAGRAHSPRARCAFSPLRPQTQFPQTQFPQTQFPVGCMRLVFSHDPPGGCRPCRISGSLWLETGGLFAVW